MWWQCRSTGQPWSHHLIREEFNPRFYSEILGEAQRPRQTAATSKISASYLVLTFAWHMCFFSSPWVLIPPYSFYLGFQDTRASKARSWCTPQWSVTHHKRGIISNFLVTLLRNHRRVPYILQSPLSGEWYIFQSPQLAGEQTFSAFKNDQNPQFLKEPSSAA